MIYNTIAAGGTFDHLHKGHKQFLQFLFTHARHVLLGITTDTYVQQNKQQVQQPFAERKKEVENFLRENNILERVTILEISDMYGPLLSNDVQVDAIGVTNDTYKAAEEINKKRSINGLDALPIVMMHMTFLPNKKPISSSAIRSGTINNEGREWIKKEWLVSNFKLPEKLRSQLHSPFGKILQKIPQEVDPSHTITVGDVTTELFNSHGLKQKLSIIDFVVERQKQYTSLSQLGFVSIEEVTHLANPAGHITAKSWNVIRSALQQLSPQIIQVEGEEDLLVLVCILVSPLGEVIYYGQPHVGLVEVYVDLVTKERAYNLMEQFVQA